MKTPTAPFADKILTGEEFALIPGLGRCELVAGKIVTMSPTNWKHGDYVSELDWHLRSFVKEHGIGKVLTGEVGIYVRRDPDHIRGADVVFISSERIAQITSESYLDVAPELVVEVISPGNTWQEMREKIDEYFAIGVDWVWLVEPERKAVAVYHSPTDSTTLGEKDTLEGEGVLTGFSLLLAELFAV